MKPKIDGLTDEQATAFIGAIKAASQPPRIAKLLIQQLRVEATNLRKAEALEDGRYARIMERLNALEELFETT